MSCRLHVVTHVIPINSHIGFTTCTRKT